MRAALYLRQSLDQEARRRRGRDDEVDPKAGTGRTEGAAIARQEKECRELCDRLGIEVADVYIDNDVSATSGVARPDFERMLADRHEAIVVWHQDRLLRLTRDLERIIALDVPVYTVVSGTLDLSNPAGRAVARTVAAWSQYEGEQKATRQRAAHRQRADRGEPWGTRRPFGFLDDGMTHHPAEAVVVRRMYDDLLGGKSQSAIARDLNAEGHRTTLGNPWRQSSVRNLLMNARNAGIITYRGEEVRQAWDGIVTEERYRAAVYVMTKNPPRKGGGRRRYLLANIAMCDVCEAKVRTSYTNRGVRMYVCPKGHVGRNAEKVDGHVVDQVLARLARPDVADLFAPDRRGDVVRDRQDAADARAALDALAEMYAAGEIQLSAFRAGTKRAQERLDDATRRLSAAGSDSGGSAVGDLIAAADPRAVWDDLGLARQRQVVDLMVEVRIVRTRRGSRFDPRSVDVEPRF